MKEVLVASQVVGFTGFPVGVGHFLASGHPLPPAFFLRIGTGCPERSIHVTCRLIHTANQVTSSQLFHNLISGEF